VPGTPALVAEHGHRRACEPPAAAGGVRTGAQGRRSPHWDHSAGSCWRGAHCTSHAAARDERPPGQPRLGRPLTAGEIGGEEENTVITETWELARSHDHTTQLDCIFGWFVFGYIRFGFCHCSRWIGATGSVVVVLLRRGTSYCMPQRLLQFLL